MTKFAHKLNISTEGALKVNLDEFFAKHKEYDMQRFADQGVTSIPFHMWMNPSADIFNQEWIEYVKTKLPPELELRDFTMFFYREGTIQFNAHIDVAPYDPPMICIFALNFTLIPDDPTEMVWYKRVNGEPFDPTKMSTYSNVPISDMEEVSRHIIGEKFVSLTNTCEYHDVDNKGLPRWCISLRTNMPYSSWEEAEKAFEPLFIE